MVKHISFNPQDYARGVEGLTIAMLVPPGYILDKIVPGTEFDWVLVCRSIDSDLGIVPLVKYVARVLSPPPQITGLR